jgi:hypothetical protein
MTSRIHHSRSPRLLYVDEPMSGLVTIFVSSLDTRSERRFDLQLPILHLKVSSIPSHIFQDLTPFFAGKTSSHHWYPR